MGKHDIRLRRQRLTARGADRFRNYGAIMKQHEEEKKIKKIVKVFIYFLVILILIILIVIISRWETRSNAINFPAENLSAHTFRL